ncbi:hypothetical protein [Hyalangium gracile]|uniref:hypothetical protein n=1 Tax=Hyalangium gracile TaxID=394092 RepID=UPI001CCDA47B|nr:hypothetical protein [Hyalangium gracile]
MRTRQWVTVMALVLGAVSSLGCGSARDDQMLTYYYKGTNTTRSPDGQITARGETLLRRVFDGPRNEIIENVLTRDEQQVVQESTLTFRVSGWSMVDPTTGFSGELKGDPWDWVQWTVTGTLPNGLTVQSTSSISENKVIVDMRFLSGETLQSTLRHELAAVLANSYDDQRAQWLPE